MQIIGYLNRQLQSHLAVLNDKTEITLNYTQETQSYRVQLQRQQENF